MSNIISRKNPYTHSSDRKITLSTRKKKKEKKRKKNRGNDKKIDFDLKGRKKVDKINLERLKRKMKT